MSDPQYPPPPMGSPLTGQPPVSNVPYVQRNETPTEEPNMIPFPFDEVLEIKTAQGTFILSQPREAMVMLQRDVPNQLLFKDNDAPSQQAAAPVPDDWFKDWSDRAEQATRMFEAGSAGVEFGTAAAPIFTGIFKALKRTNGAPKAAPTKTAKYQPSSYSQAPVSSKYYPSNPASSSRPVSLNRPGSSGTHVSATTPTRTSYERPNKYDGYSSLPAPPNRPPNSQDSRPGSSQNSYPAYPQGSSRPHSSSSHHQTLKPNTQASYFSHSQSSRPISSSEHSHSLKPTAQTAYIAHQPSSSRPTSSSGNPYIAPGRHSFNGPQGYVQDHSSHPVSPSRNTGYSFNNTQGYVHDQGPHSNIPPGASYVHSNRLSSERPHSYKVSPAGTPTRTSFSKPRPSAEYVTTNAARPTGNIKPRPPPPSAFENNFAKPLRRQSTLGKTLSGLGKILGGSVGKKR